MRDTMLFTFVLASIVMIGCQGNDLEKTLLKQTADLDESFRRAKIVCGGEHPSPLWDYYVTGATHQRRDRYIVCKGGTWAPR